MTRLISLILFTLPFYGIPVQSQCLIDSITVDVRECSGGQADLWLDFQYSNAPDSGLFEVKGNGKLYGTFAYADLPVKLGTVEIVPTLYYEFEVRDLELDSCFNSLDYGLIQCSNSNCQIRDLSATIMDSCVDGSYPVQLDFISEGITDVDLFVDGEFLQFVAISDLPKQVHIPNYGQQHNQIKVFANDQHECFASLTLTAPECSMGSCGISNLEAKAKECDDSTFYVQLDFDHFGPHSDLFQVIGNGEDYGVFSYAELPLWLGPFRSGEKEVLEFLVRDSLNQDCVLETTVDGSPCQHFCSIGALRTEIIQCDSGLFNISIDFEYSGAVSDSFKLKGNGQFYGLYAYSDLPVQLEALRADGITKYEFVVVDQQAACRNYVDLGTVDCFCLWSDLAFDAGDCTSDSTYAITVNFTPGNVDSFNLVTEGRHLGTFSVEELPLTIDNFPASGGTFDELWICASLTNCCERFDIESPICARKPCSISEVQVTPLECAEGKHKFLLDFAHEGNASDHFLVKKNDEWVGRYKYAELPVKIGPFWGMDSTTYILKIIDAINEDCVTEIEVIDPGCHDCHVGDIKVEVGECTSDSTYRIILNAEIQGAFDFYVNGHFCGTFESGALPLTIDDFPASGEAYDYIKICSLDSSYCCKEKKIESPVCARSSCPFENARFELTECDSNNIFYATIFLDTFGLPEGTFIVQRDNALFEFSYASLPVRIGPLQGGETFYKYKIYDAINTQCRADLTIGRVICSSQCDLEVGKIDIAECNEEEVILLIDSVQGSYPGFDVTFGDQYLGFHKKEQLPLRLKAKLPEQGDEVSVKICVSDNITCCVEKSLSLSNCGSVVSCGIGALQFDTVECRNDSFYVNLNFIDNNVDSGSYLLKINGERWDEFSSADLPLHVGPLAAGADRKYSILVQSGLNEGCVAELEFGGVECPASSLEAGLRLLVVQSNNFTNYIKVPDFISDRSIFQLFDLGGRLMYEMEFSADTRRAVVQVPVNVAGMYLVKIKAKDGQQHLSKIIVP